MTPLNKAFSIIKEGGQMAPQSYQSQNPDNGAQTVPFASTESQKPPEDHAQKRLKNKEKQTKFAEGAGYDFANDVNLSRLLEEFQPAANDTKEWVNTLRNRLGSPESHLEGHKETEKKAKKIADAVHEFQLLNINSDPSVAHLPDRSGETDSTIGDADSYDASY